MRGSTSELLRAVQAAVNAGRHGARRRLTSAVVIVLVLLSSPALHARADDGVASDATLRASVSAALVRPEGAGFVAHRWQREPRIVALYFGADWCAPCHAFVPTLREVRDALQAAGADTEVVYVSLDGSDAEMRRYMRRQAMPWPAIDHRRLRALPAVRALGGPAPPNLVLVDARGAVLASAWDGQRYRGLQRVLDAWLQAVAVDADDRAAPMDAGGGSSEVE